MQRIVILGCSGTGKSTLARQVGERLGLPVVHLDALFWGPGWTEPDNAVFRERVKAALAQGRWVSEGVYISRTFDLRLPHAELIVWLDQPRWLRFVRVAWRAFRYRKGGRVDIGPDCPENLEPRFLRYIWSFDRVTRPRIEAELARLAPQTPVLRLNGDRQIAAWLESMAP
jgi:adenylate kinase family enzyme